MPWKEVTTMSQRKTFVGKANQPNRNMSQLCREFGISRKTGYKWLKRYQQQGEVGLEDRSRRPKHSPRQTAPEIEKKVLAIRQQHPSWGGRKLRARLKALGHNDVPSPSTITEILRRNNKITKEESNKRKALKRFEKASPNEMWQMDFKASFMIGAQKCHPLTILDDHSRFLIGLQACADQKRQTVEQRLADIFRNYGLPESILVDNGPPWGPSDRRRYYTGLIIWLMRLGIQVIRSRPFHPQTLGKDERLHRSLQTEVINRYSMVSFEDCQAHFDAWQQIYNTQRPHEALGLVPPASRYQPSSRNFPETLPPIMYAPHDHVLKVSDSARIWFQGRRVRIGRAFAGLPVAIRPTSTKDTYDVFFSEHKIKTITLG